MTRTQTELALTRWLETYQKLTEQVDAFAKITDSPPDSPLQNAIYKTFDAYTDALSELVGDQGGWLSWFIYDNDAGKKAHFVVIDKKRRHIRTVKDLVWVLTYHANKP